MGSPMFPPTVVIKRDGGLVQLPSGIVFPLTLSRYRSRPIVSMRSSCIKWSHTYCTTVAFGRRRAMTRRQAHCALARKAREERATGNMSDLGANHGAGCECPAHRAASAKGGASARHATTPNVPKSGREWLASLLPALACAVCPACLATYAKALSVAGFSAWLSERGHLAFLVVAVALSLGFGVRRARAIGSYRPFAFTLVGCALLVAGHVLGDIAWLTWTGLVALFVGGVYGQRLHLRRAAQGHSAERTALPSLGAGPAAARPAPRKGQGWRIVGQKERKASAVPTQH